MVRHAKRQGWIGLGAAAALLLPAPPAGAADGKQKQGYFGGLLGLAIPSTSGASLRLTYGANGGYNLSQDWTVGAFVLTSSESATVTVSGSGSVSTSQRTSFFGVEGHYNLSQVAKGAHAGLKVGLVTDSASTSKTSSSNTDVTIGPKIAYDYELDPTWSVGGEFNTMFILKDNSSTVINFLGVVKFWW
jgi:hypothetical protein